MNRLFDLMRSVIALGSKLKCNSMIDEADHCEEILEELRGVVDLYKALEDKAEFGDAVKWSAKRGMYATNESGLAMVLKRYREFQKEEVTDE